MILLVLLASILILVVTVIQYDEQTKDYNIQRFERKEATTKQIIDLELTSKTSYAIKTENLRKIFYERIYEISSINKLNITIFDLHGNLLISSKTNAFEKNNIEPLNSGLLNELEKLGFNIAGYGCMTCIGNSGELDSELNSAIEGTELVVSAVLSGNRNFEGRVHPLTKANYLASPPLCVLYALSGTVDIDMLNDPIGIDNQGNSITMKDLWPTNQEISEIIKNCINKEMF